MNVSLEYLQRCAAQTGYRVEPLEKVIRLGRGKAAVPPNGANNNPLPLFVRNVSDHFVGKTGMQY